MDDKTKYVWRMWGKWYGYPDCCVEAFCRGEQKRGGVFLGTGFVPCAKCYDKPVEDVVANMKVNRLSPQDFCTTDLSCKETRIFIESFWQCMEGSYDKNENNA